MSTQFDDDSIQYVQLKRQLKVENQLTLKISRLVDEVESWANFIMMNMSPYCNMDPYIYIKKNYGRLVLNLDKSNMSVN